MLTLLVYILDRKWKADRILNFVLMRIAFCRGVPSSKVGFFVLFCRFVHWPSENKEVSYYYTVRSDDVKVLKSRWNFVTKTTTPGNNIYTLLRTFIAFSSFISSKFQTIFPIQTLILRHTWPILRLLAPSHRRATKQLKCYTFTTHE